MEPEIKKHSTFMKDIRDMEKRLLAVELEHNKLTRFRKIYAKSACHSRPYLAERIAARFRPQTVPCRKLKKNVQLDFVEENNKNGSGIFKDGCERRALSRASQDSHGRTLSASSVRPFSRTSFVSNSNQDTSIYRHDDRKGFARPVVKRTASKTSLHSTENKATSVRSFGSARSSAGKVRPQYVAEKRWTYRQMPINAEKQSIYTMVLPPAWVAEETGKIRSKNFGKYGHKTKQRKQLFDLHPNDHVVRFQGIPHEAYTEVHENNQSHEKFYMQHELAHCRYLRTRHPMNAVPG